MSCPKIIMFAMMIITASSTSVFSADTKPINTLMFKQQINPASIEKAIQASYKPSLFEIMAPKLELRIDRLKHQLEDAKKKSNEVRVQLETCKNKAYTRDDMKNAGCYSNDTVEICSKKLLTICMGRKSDELSQMYYRMKCDGQDIAYISYYMATGGKKSEMATSGLYPCEITIE